MFARLAYFIVLLAACSCQTYTPTDPMRPSNISGIFFRYFPKEVTKFVDVSLKNGVDLLKEKTFNKGHVTIIYVQTWLQNANSPAPQELVKAFLKNLNSNQVIFDWSNINTDSSYAYVASEVEKVGTALGKQLCKMFAAGLSPRRTELIGLFIGAHVAGQAGKTVKETCKHTVGRIVALDAARSLFYFPLPIYRRMDKDDAVHTTAIHTSGLQHGVFQRIAKADFYVNAGISIQPGCGLASLFNYCNMIRSWQLYVESINEPDAFRAARADNCVEFYFQTCEDNAKEEAVYMGDEEYYANGTYYLTTNGEPPYGKRDKGLCI